MKRTSRWTAALLSLALLLSLSAARAAGDARLPEGVTPVAILIDGRTFSGQNERGETVRPFAYDGTTYVPIRALGNALGYGVSWDSAKACVVVDTKGKPTAISTKTGGTEAPLPPGVSKIDKILINKQVFKGYNERGEKVTPFAYDGTTYVPIRALGLALKYEVGWDGATSSVTVSTGGTAVPVPSAAPAPSSGNTGAPVAGQIAGAIAGDVGSFNTSSLSSVIVPELGAASGYRLSSREDPNVDGVEEYTYNMDDTDFAKAEANTLQAVREYFGLIASLPYFEVAEEINLRSGFYSGGLRYTGTSPAVKKNTLTTFNGKVACDVAFRLDADDHSVTFEFAPGLKVVDTGDRLSFGKGYAAPTLTGPRAREAFCCDNGTYYNAGDRALSVKAGGVSLLVNGEPCTGTVDFHTEASDQSWAVDKFTISGFQRSQWIEFAFPMNYGQTGDFYTAADFRRWSEYPYATTNRGALWAFAVSANNGNDFVMPMANRENTYEAVNVRVVKWDKSGDTVIYFYAKLTLNGSPYEVEGLLAAPNRVEEAKPSGGSGGEGECWYCGGSGTCPTCGGSGKVSNWMPGTQHTFLEQNCTDCYRNGKCRHCGGSGRG